MTESFNLPLPAVKKKTGIKREYPFPIVTSSCHQDSSVDPNFEVTIAHLQDDSVLVHDESSIRMLYTMGYFGKGTLSKNAPQVCSKKPKDVSAENKQEILPSTSKSTDDEFIDVVDSSDEDKSSEGTKESDEIEIVLSDSNSGASGKASPAEKEQSQETISAEKESLQLTFEEAYFLSYGLGCLVVMDSKNEPMDLARLWNRFCELTPNGSFPVFYTAYHHFRSKGWVVKSGLKYGVDYVLYKDGPPFYHATYSVVVKPVKEQNLRDARGNKQLSWPSLSALNRINTSAGKALMFLYVIKPNTMSENKISTPFCISEYLLEEVLINRWVPSENREESDR